MIRPFEDQDWPSFWRLFEPVIREGRTYALDPSLGEDEAKAFWLSPKKAVFAIEVEGELAGSYYAKPNQDGPGAHVANCGYVTHPKFRGRGLAARMCQHSLEWARRQGFLSMQFNLVVSTNQGAVRLWKRNGFEVVGTLPEAFEHPEKGLVEAYVMHRNLGDPAPASSDIDVLDALAKLEAWHFGGKGSGLEDPLAKLVLEGTKTATSSWFESYAVEGIPLPQEGEQSLILDSQDLPVAVVELFEVRVRPFLDVDEEFAAQEGEGDLSLRFWREAHDRFFAGYAQEIGIEWKPEVAQVVTERFRVVYGFPEARRRLRNTA